MNGANPVMQRIRPILEANIQEHSVMKYQEQMTGVAESIIEQMPAENQKDPAVIDMVMAKASEQVMNANKALGQAQSPEQQLVALEQAKVELQKQKLESDTMVQAAEMEIKNKQLELNENDQIIDMLKAGSSDNIKKEKIDKDIEAKVELKSIDLEVAQQRLMKDLVENLNKDQSDLDMKGLEALVKLAIEKSKQGD